MRPELTAHERDVACYRSALRDASSTKDEKELEVLEKAIDELARLSATMSPCQSLKKRSPGNRPRAVKQKPLMTTADNFDRAAIDSRVGMVATRSLSPSRVTACGATVAGLDE
jgi:hypothetical protein